MAKKPKPPVLYGTTEAARLVGCSENTMRDYANKGVCNPIRTNTNRCLFREPDISAAKREYEKSIRYKIRSKAHDQ